MLTDTLGVTKERTPEVGDPTIEHFIADHITTTCLPPVSSRSQGSPSLWVERTLTLICLLEWQLDNNGQPLQDSEDSEGSVDEEALNKIQGRTRRSVASETVRGPDAKRMAKHMISGPDDTAPFGAPMHRDHGLKHTFLVDRDSDAKASWRRGQPWTGG